VKTFGSEAHALYGFVLFRLHGRSFSFVRVSFMNVHDEPILPQRIVSAFDDVTFSDTLLSFVALVLLRLEIHYNSSGHAFAIDSSSSEDAAETKR